MTSENMELKDGRWVPSIPLPLIGPLRVRCECGRHFWRLAHGKQSWKPPGYVRHYQQEHLR